MAASWKVFGEEFRGFIEEGIKKQSKELGEIINGLREKLKERERKWKETRRDEWKGREVRKNGGRYDGGGKWKGGRGGREWKRGRGGVRMEQKRRKGTEDKRNAENIRMERKRGKKEKCGNLEGENRQGRRKGRGRKNYESNRSEC
ncbi:hypothetical protein RF55_9888 [Lasius niger]|uniref:Uncharacterized protein n=1 Tax=Lasius niger TaxID=67767 RepID=A0A0J7KIV6_LASNI|nr:hypothetical protein RF55_9888 [Lasius niger]